MDYIDPALHSSGERPDDVTERAEPIRPAAPPREEDPRVQRVRLQLELAIRELDASIRGFEQEREGLDRDIAFMQLQRVQLQKLAELDPPVFAHVLAVLKLQDPLDDEYDEHLTEALRHA